jgi:type I restriction enzyme S subunit
MHLDLVVMADKPLATMRLADLKEEFSESDLPFKVDVVDWAATKEGFRKIIEKQAISFRDKLSQPLTELVAINPQRKLPKGIESTYIAMDQLPIDARNIDKIEKREFSGSGAKFQNGDTLLARITPCLENGKTAFVKCLAKNEIAHGSTEFIVLSGKEGKSDHLFVYYFARSPEFRAYAISQMEGSSGRQRVPAITLEKYPVNFPNLDSQRTIAYILGTLDDKIELNRKMNQTLEGIARAYYKSWFVDFGPVKKKAAGEPTGLPEEIDKLFPNEFEESELGKIPKGWGSFPLSEITSLLNRGIQPSYIEKNGILIVNQKCIREQRLQFADARRHDIRIKDPGVKLLNIGDVLINSTGVGTLGRIAQVRFLPEPGTCDSHVSIARANLQKCNSTFLGFNLMNRQSEIEGLGEGSTGQTELNRARLAKLNCVVPGLTLQNLFEKCVKPELEEITLNENQIVLQSALRDALLPLLLSGKLPIKNVDKFLQKAGL